MAEAQKETIQRQQPTAEQKHFRTLQAMLHGRRRLQLEERQALDYSCTLIAQRGFEQALPDD